MSSLRRQVRVVQAFEDKATWTDVKRPQVDLL
jgi:hypothetical protein